MNSLFAVLSAVAATLPTPLPGKEPPAKADERPAQAQPSDRICRRVALDVSSRKKEEVCLTAKEWREFNTGR